MQLQARLWLTVLAGTIALGCGPLYSADPAVKKTGIPGKQKGTAKKASESTGPKSIVRAGSESEPVEPTPPEGEIPEPARPDAAGSEQAEDEFGAGVFPPGDEAESPSDDQQDPSSGGDAKKHADDAKKHAALAKHWALMAKQSASDANAHRAASENYLMAARLYAESVRFAAGGFQMGAPPAFQQRAFAGANTAAVAVGDLYPKRAAGPAQTVHAVFCSLTDDAGGIGEGAQANRQFLQSLFNTEFANCRDRLRTYDISGAQFTRQRLLSTIDAIPAGSQDTVFCYISTHGLFDARQGQGFSTNLAESGPSHQVKIWRSEIMTHLLQRNARQTILISDSCAEVHAAPASVLGAPAGETAAHPLFDLLFHFEGVLSVNAASPTPPNDVALYIANDNTRSGGGLFTRAFCNRAVFARNITGWQTFFQAVASQLTTEQLRFPSDPHSPPCIFSSNGAPYTLAGVPIPVR